MYLGPQMAKIRVENRKGVNFLHCTIWGPPLKIKILKIGLRHVLSWPKLSLGPKFHDSGTFFTFFALDRLGAPFLQKSYFYLKRVQKFFDQKYFFL